MNNNKEDEQKDIPIENLIFEYKCTACEVYPIVCVMFYCQKCNYYLCEQCEKKEKMHKHPLLKIETKKQLLDIKEEENKKLEEKRKRINNDYNNYNNFYNFNRQQFQNTNNDFYSNRNNMNYNQNHIKIILSIIQIIILILIIMLKIIIIIILKKMHS